MCNVILVAIEKLILFTREVDIRRISFDTPSFVDVTLPVTGLQFTIGLDWNGRKNTIYWGDYFTGTISMASLEVGLCCKHTHAYTHARTHTRIHTHVHTHICTHTHTRMHIAMQLLMLR